MPRPGVAAGRSCRRRVGGVRAGRRRRRRSRSGSARCRRAPRRRGPSRRKALAIVGPPSTKTRCTPRSRSSVSTAVRSSPDRCSSGRGCRSSAAPSGTPRSPSTTGIGWLSYRRAVGLPGGEGGVVREDGAGADDDRVGPGAPSVHVGARLGAGDPLARAVGGRGATVEALRPLHRDVRTPEALHLEPGREQFGGCHFEQSRLDLDSRFAQTLALRRWTRGWGRQRVDHALDAGGQKRLRAGAGAAGVVAGLEGDDRGRAACCSRRRAATARRPRRAPCRRRGATLRRSRLRRRRGSRRRPAGCTPRGPRRASSSARPMALRSAAFTDIRILRSRLREWRTAARSRRSCCLPSGLAAFLLHHRRSRNSTGSASATPESDADALARGLSPPVRIHTDPGARIALESTQRVLARFIPCRCMNLARARTPGETRLNDSCTCPRGRRPCFAGHLAWFQGRADARGPGELR